jgi:hypothetical protein
MDNPFGTQDTGRRQTKQKHTTIGKQTQKNINKTLTLLKTTGGKIGHCFRNQYYQN